MDVKKHERQRHALNHWLKTRPTLQQLETRAIVRHGGFSMRCELEERAKYQSPVWKWRVDASIPCRVWQLASGVEFMIYITPTGECFGVGTPTAMEMRQIQLRSRSFSMHQTHPTNDMMRLASSMAHGNWNMKTPLPIRQLTTRYGIRQIACGVSHVLALGDHHNTLFSYGVGVYGQLGLGPTIQQVDQLTPLGAFCMELQTMVTSIASHERILLRCGPFTSAIAIQSSSQLWLCGRLVNEITTVPIVSDITDNLMIQDIRLGVDHGVVLTMDGRVFTWGRHDVGQRGSGLQEHEDVRCRVSFGSDVKIQSITCGWYHTLAVSTDHQVLAWGSNRFGACGVKSKFFTYFAPANVHLPSLDHHMDMRVEAHGHTSMVRITDKHSRIVKNVWMWGVCGPTTASFVPIEVPGVEDQPRLQSPVVLNGTSAWIYHHQDNEKEPVELWQWRSEDELTIKRQETIQLHVHRLLPVASASPPSKVVVEWFQPSCVKMRVISSDADHQTIEVTGLKTGTTRVRLRSGATGSVVLGGDLQLHVQEGFASLLSARTSEPSEQDLVVQQHPLAQPTLEPIGIFSQLSVAQDPSEFLVSVSSCPESMLPPPASTGTAVDDVMMWRDDRNDLLYASPRVMAGTLQIYEHPSPFASQDAQSNRILHLRRQLYEFLWSKRHQDGNFTTLFHHLSRSQSILKYKTWCRMMQTWRFASFPKCEQERFALFQSLSVSHEPPVDGISFAAFKTFLLDPHHTVLWQQLIASIRHLSVDQLEENLDQAFGNSADCDFAVLQAAVVSLFPEIVDGSTLCRLAYRFDRMGTGVMDVTAFKSAFIASLQSFKSHKPQTSHTKRLFQGKRPDLVHFSTPTAVQKLYQRRARVLGAKKHKNSIEMLLEHGNSRLARIRNLPVRQVLREGIYFRPQRYRTHEEADDEDDDFH